MKWHTSKDYKGSHAIKSVNLSTCTYNKVRLSHQLRLPMSISQDHLKDLLSDKQPSAKHLGTPGSTMFL